MPDQTRELNDLFVNHYPGLVGWCRKRVRGGLDDPEDYVHAAYLRCCRHWSVERQSRDHGSSYFYRALKWALVDAIRKKNSERRRLCLMVASRPDDREQPLRHLIATEALHTLQGRQGQICRAFLNGKTDREVQAELRLSQGAIAVHSCRARMTLAAWLDVPSPRRAGRTSGNEES